MSAIWESANWTRQFGIRQFGMLPLTALYTTIYMYNYKTCFEHINCQYLTNKVLLKINYVNLHNPQINYVYMTLYCLTDIDLYQKIHYAI